jgi:hypothetical protein
MSIVGLLNELKLLTPADFAQLVRLEDLNTAYGQRIDFDNWLRRCATPGREFAGLQAAYQEYFKSFG